MNMMKQLPIVMLLLSSLGVSYHQNDCPCVAPEPNETTHQGGNEVITVIEKKTYKSVRGVVRNVNGEPMEGVLVELFDKPEWIRKDHSSSPEDQNRIAACKTGPDGKFCFENIPAGEYELRGSKDSGWNPSHILVKVDPYDPKASDKGIRLQMTVGT